MLFCLSMVAALAGSGGWGSDLMSSGDLFDDAQARGDAIGMVVAAEMRARAMPGGVDHSEVRTAESMWAAAARFATGPTAAVVESRPLSRQRGAKDGPVVTVIDDAPDQRQPFTVVFEANRSAIIFVEGPSGDSFTLRVLSDEAVLCEDDSRHWRKLCRFVPMEDLTAELIVSGGSEAAYLVVTN